MVDDGMDRVEKNNKELYFVLTLGILGVSVDLL